MIELSRTMRFCLSDGSSAGAGVPPQETPRHNAYSAWPAMRGLGRYYELTITCRGEADARTGYFLNIKHIDHAFHEHLLGYLEDLIARAESAAAIPLGELMQRLLGRLYEPLAGTVVQLRLHLTPRYSLEIRSHDMEHVIVRQQYDFSASHRLHVPELSEEENRALFGKCNNPAGHGHNYRVEVAIRVPIAPTGDILDIEELDAVVDEHVLELLDHKHLNQDVPQFAQLNPSVEHIAQVIWEMLAQPVAKVGPAPGVSLDEIRVWETEKTLCAYRGPEGG